MNKFLYMFLIVGGHMATLVLAYFGSQRATQEAAPFIPLPMLVATIGYLSFVYKMWAALPADARRTTPGKAVGLLFVPFYNIYWVFNVLPGFATDFNRYAAYRAPTAPRVSFGLLVAFVLLMSVPVVNWVVLALAINNVADAVNGLARAAAQPQQPWAGQPAMHRAA